MRRGLSIARTRQSHRSRPLLAQRPRPSRFGLRLQVKLDVRRHARANILAIRTPALFALLLLSCGRSAVETPAAVPAPSTASSQPLVVIRRDRPQAPASVGEYTQTQQEFGGLKEGSHTRYRAPDGVELDIFVYPIPWPDALCASTCAADWVAEEARAFAAEAPSELVRLGYFPSMVLETDSMLAFADSTISTGRHLMFVVTDAEGRRGRSDYLLTSHHGYRIKLRLTDFEGRTDSLTALEFFRALLAQIEPPYVCALGPAKAVPGLGIESILDHEFSTVAVAVDSLMRTRKWELKFADTGVWTTVPQFTWPANSESESWHGDVHPGYQVLVQAERRGDSTAFSVHSPMVCEIGDQGIVDGQPLSRTLQLLVAGGFAVDLGKLLDSLTGR
jgi:hypothetical protein